DDSIGPEDRRGGVGIDLSSDDRPVGTPQSDGANRNGHRSSGAGDVGGGSPFGPMPGCPVRSAIRSVDRAIGLVDRATISCGQLQIATAPLRDSSSGDRDREVPATQMPMASPEAVPADVTGRNGEIGGEWGGIANGDEEGPTMPQASLQTAGETCWD